MIIIGTSVLLDVLSNDPVWANRSQMALENAAAADDLAINDIVYAELCSGYESIEALDRAVSVMQLRHVPIPRAALFLAGRAFLRYRKRGGTKSGVLSDFFIGAHAAFEGWPILTRDTRRIVSYFPTVRLIAPTPRSWSAASAPPASSRDRARLRPNRGRHQKAAAVPGTTALRSALRNRTAFRVSL